MTDKIHVPRCENCSSQWTQWYMGDRGREIKINCDCWGEGSYKSISVRHQIELFEQNPPRTLSDNKMLSIDIILVLSSDISKRKFLHVPINELSSILHLRTALSKEVKNSQGRHLAPEVHLIFWRGTQQLNNGQPLLKQGVQQGDTIKVIAGQLRGGMEHGHHDAAASTLLALRRASASEPRPSRAMDEKSPEDVGRSGSLAQESALTQASSESARTSSDKTEEDRETKNLATGGKATDPNAKKNQESTDQTAIVAAQQREARLTQAQGTATGE